MSALTSVTPALADPPPLAALQPASLFIDFDGTLVELIDRPDQVRVDAPLHDLLARLAAAMPGRVAIVSGRSLAQIDGFLGPLAWRLDVAASHGAEQRLAGAGVIAPARPASLDDAGRAFAAFAARRPGVLVETKTFGEALHYRMAPEAEAEARALAETVAGGLGLKVQLGKMMVELRAPADKGDAVRAFLARAPMAGTRPVVIGDDLTDEGAFAVALERGGLAILAGPLHPTGAGHHLADVAAVRAWLAAGLA